jgi:hypothetical protein
MEQFYALVAGGDVTGNAGFQPAPIRRLEAGAPFHSR